MNKLILTFFLLFSALSPSDGWGSGSGTVFLPGALKYNQYVLTIASREETDNPALFDFLEAINYSSPYLIRLEPRNYLWVNLRVHAGYGVKIEFEGYETITFFYYPGINAIMGFNSKNEPILLQQ